MNFYQQYEFVKSSRKVLLEYCKNISDKNFLVENDSFGRGSIRNLLVHIINCYEFWIGKHALNKDIRFTENTFIKDALQAEDLFLTIDSLLEELINLYSKEYLNDLRLEIDDQYVLASPLKLFTHVITHEFHHKGQILSLSRHLGYVPVDTDVIR